MSYDLGTAHGKIVLDYNGDRAVNQAERDIDRLQRKSKETDGSMSKLGKTLSVFGKGVAVTGLVVGLTHAAASAAALGIQILGIVPSLLSIGSLAAGLPAVFGALAITMGVLKAATAGFGDAIKAAFDPEGAEKFNEALEKLSPKAREAALAIKSIVPGLRDFQQGLQEAFFRGIDLNDVTGRLLPILGQLRGRVYGLAQDFGNLARWMLDFVTSSRSVQFVSDLLDVMRANIAKIFPVLEPLMTGLRAVGEVGLGLFDRLGTAIAKVGIQFGNWLNEIAASGQLQEWINTAIATLRTLGTILGNVGSILNSVFSAAQASGGGLLNTLAQITGEFAAFLNSAQGQESITALFSGIMQVASQLVPVITTLAGALARALGPALQKLALTVGPALLDVVERLAPAFGPLANGLADMAGAVAPLLGPIAQLVSLLATSLGGALSALAAEIGPVVELLAGTFADALTLMAPLLRQMAASALPLAAALGQQLLTAVQPLVPVIMQFAQALVDALLPALPQLTDAAIKLIPSIVQLATALSGSLVSSLQAIIPMLPTIVSGFVQFATAMTTVQGFMLRTIATFISFGSAVSTTILGAINWIRQLPTNIGNALRTAASFVVSIGAQIIAWFTQLPARVRAALAALPGAIVAIARRALNLMATAIGTGLGLAVGLLVKFPARAAAALASLAASIRARAVAAWNSFMSATTSGIARVLASARTLPGRTVAAISSLAGQISALASRAWNAFRARVAAGVNSAVAAVRGLPGRIRGALASLPGLLVGSGAAMIQGLINGISGGIGRVMSMVGGLASRVKGAFNSALSIFSPSRVFFESGRFIDEGLILGIKSKLRDVGLMATRLANSVIAPTVNLPSVTAGNLNAVVPTSRTAIAEELAKRGGDGGSFGPYQIVVGGKVLAEIMVDAISGNPKVVHKASKEGARQSAFA